MKLFGREPALWIGVIQATLGLIVTLGFAWLDATDATNIVATLTALAGVATAISTRPWRLSIFTGAVSTVAVLFAGYGLNFTQEQVGAVQLILVTVVTLVARNQITPEADPRPLTAVAAVVHGPPDSELHR